MTARPLSSRGYTLLELVIAMGVTSILIAAAVTLLVNQQRAFQVGSDDRGLQEAGQTALIAVGDRLRQAGYGMDPAYVLDFGDVAQVPQQGLKKPQKRAHFQTYRCDDPVRCRDQSAGPGSDEIVFYTRNPMFSRPVIAANPGALQIRGDLKRPIRPGQVLMVMCLSGDRTRAYVTAGAKVAAAGVPDPANPVDILLAPAVLTGGLSTFPFQNDQLADACFSDGNAVVAQVDRHRYYVAWFMGDGAEVAPQTIGARPFLMLDQGLLDDDDELIVTPVAQDVEDLQLTYFFTPNAAGGPVRASGAIEGTDIAGDDPAVTVAVPPPVIDDPPEAPSRATGSPVNILSVRVSVVVRSPEPDLALAAAAHRALPAAANRGSFDGAPNFRRALFEDTFPLPNLRSTTVVHCAVGATPGMNLGGC